MDTGTRTGITYLANDGSDPVTAYRTSIRSLAAWAEAQGALYAQGLLSARPAAGKAGRLYRATDDTAGVIYYDDGTTWQSIGAAAAVDAAANVGSLRTLGAGSLQAAAGNHAHAIGAITGTGDSVTKNVGTATGTVAAGDHTHTAAGTGTQYAYKTADTNRASTTTRTADPHLSLTLGTGTWLVDADLLILSSSTTPDFNVAFVFSGTGTVQTGPIAIGPAASTTDYSATTMNVSVGASSATFGTTTSYGYVRMREVLVVSVSGALTVNWAQGTSNATATTLVAGSQIIAQKLA